VKIIYFNKKEREKRVTWVILDKKFDLKSLHLMDEGEETKILVTVHKKKGEKYMKFSPINYQTFY